MRSSKPSRGRSPLVTAPQGIQPSVCLYFTDMKCSRYPEAEPGFPVAWINWGPPPSQWNCEPWGERIDITA